MANAAIAVRRIRRHERDALGELTATVYAALPGFPSPAEQPDYYALLRGIGRFDDGPHSHVLVALDGEQRLLGGVVYFDDMSAYGSGGAATGVKQAAGIRLLAVDPRSRGRGVGRALTLACLEQARVDGLQEVILHTTKAMQAAWRMYERIGFERSPDLDFEQKGLPVLGFRFNVRSHCGAACPAVVPGPEAVSRHRSQPL